MNNHYKSLEDLPPFLSAPQLADLLNISRAQAYVLFHQRGFPAIKIGERRLVCSKAALLQWLNEREKMGI